ncbi:MAG: LemA family protein [Betaproteobacteria bacterium]
MVFFLLLLLVLSTLTIGYGAILHRGLTRLERDATAARDRVGAALGERHDELSGLIEICQAQEAFDPRALAPLVLARNDESRARRAGNLMALGRADALLRKELVHAVSASDDCKPLASDPSFRHKVARIVRLEQQIARERADYNGAAALYNERLGQFPDNVLVGLVRFPQHRLLASAEVGEKPGDLRTLFV